MVVCSERRNRKQSEINLGMFVAKFTMNSFKVVPKEETNYTKGRRVPIPQSPIVQTLYIIVTSDWYFIARNFGHLSPHGSSGFSQSIIKMAYENYKALYEK